MDENTIIDAPIVEMGLVITKAAFDKAEPNPDRKRRITLTNSDTLPDLYEESMSMDLFKDFTDRITNNTPVPDVFKSVVCEEGVWCGGKPYLSIAHYRAGVGGKNLPGSIESVYVDGGQLKSKAYLHDNPLGRALFDAICSDVEQRKSGVSDFKPVRVSIGFLDLEHEHITSGKSITFTRTGLGQKCPLCEDGVGGKIYKKGQLVHLATTRVPVNPRTGTSLEEKSMGEIITKKDDAASIVGEDLAKELDEKSLASDVLVIKSDEVGSSPVQAPAPFAGCYDPNTDSFSQECIDASMRGFMASIRNEMTAVKSDTVDKLFDEVSKSLSKLQGKPVVEESMEKVIEKAKEVAKDEEEVEESKEKDGVKEDSVAVASPLDTEFEKLKAVVASGKATRDQLQEVFNSLGQAVEKEYVAPPASINDIAAIVKSAVEEAMKPYVIKFATIEAQKSDTVSRSLENPLSRAISVTPEALVKKSQQPERKLTQIERIARKSTGADQ